LQPVEGAAPPPAPTPEPVAVSPYNGAADDFVSNEPGCASTCITSALLRKDALQPDLDFEIKTNVNAKVHIWISTNSPTIISGIPVFPGVTPRFSPGFAKTWQTELKPLEYDTKYYVIVRATDYYGHQQYALTSLTTREEPGMGELIGNGGGCYYQCITDAHVQSTIDYSQVDLSIATNTAATLHVAISTQQPGTIAGKPFLPQDEDFALLPGNGPVQHGRASGLAPDTVYNVVVKATDNDGFTAHRVGQFRTSPLPPRVPSPTDVLIRFEKITITGDGDISPGNRGEIQLAWGFKDGSLFGLRDWDTLDAGAVVDLPDDSGRWVRIEPGGALPQLLANGREDDHVVGEGMRGCRQGGFGLTMIPANDDDDCGVATNVAFLDQREVGWLNTIPACAGYGFSGEKANDKCFEIRSADMGNDYPEFKVLVSYHIG
jgi:hypothetical protein